MFESIFTWLADNRRDPTFLADRCSLSPDRLRMLVCSHAVPSDDELAALAEVLGVPVEDMQRSVGPIGGLEVVHPARCYSAADVSDLVGVSVDTVYAMMAERQLYWKLVGDRLKRVPHFALIGFLMGYDWEIQRVMACPPPGHIGPDGQAAPAGQAPETPPPPRQPPAALPGRDEDAAQPARPEPRLF